MTREPGDRPTDPGKESIVPRRVTLTLTPQAYELLETARSEATRGAGGHVDDSAFVTEVALGYLNRGASGIPAAPRSRSPSPWTRTAVR